jgi:UDP-2,4-diacetamido-2,4,6-trideoxy-beta-L-altropyranose hydrolase
MKPEGDKRLVFRADSSAVIGTGHVMRCLALAQAWSDGGGKASFLTTGNLGSLETHLRSEGCEVVSVDVRPGSAEEARRTADWAKSNGASWVVVDGYHFGADYQRVVKETGLRLLFVDDNGHAERYCADIVLNQNLYAHKGLYPNRESYTRLLLGPKYALLRREFSKWRDWTREIPAVARKILVTLGGADAENATLKAIQGLRRLQRRDLEIKIVVGPANAHLETLRREAGRAMGSVELLTAVRDVPALMAWADAAISAGGSTCWELAFMGLAACIVVVADNQASVADVLEKRGAAINLGRHGPDVPDKLAEAMERLLEAGDRRREMSRIGRLIVDGGGSRRVAESIREKSGAPLEA